MAQTREQAATPARRSWRFFAIIGSVVAVVLLIAYFGISAYVASVVTSTERRPFQGTPDSIGLAYESVAFPAAEDNIQLKGWLVKSTTASDRIVIITHGKSASRAEKNVNGLGMIGALAKHGFNVLAYDLRGYGESGGEHFSLGQFEQRDLLGAVSFVESKGYQPAHIGAWGYSMGAATTIMTAARTSDIHAVLSDSSYASLPDLLDEVFTRYSHLPNLFLPGTLFMGKLEMGFDPSQVLPEKAITQLGSRHVYLIQGLSDNLVNPADVDRLAKAAGSSLAGEWKVPGVDHVQAFVKYPDEYTQRITDFFTTELS